MVNGERLSPDEAACYRYIYIYMMTGITKHGGVSKIRGIIYGEAESPNEGARLRCDEPPVLLAIVFANGGGGVAAPPATPRARFLKPCCERVLANVAPSSTLFSHLRLVVAGQARKTIKNIHKRPKLGPSL